MGTLEERHYEERLVAIDQSFSNYAMVLFVDGVVVDRKVIHTGNPYTTKNKKKDQKLTNSKFYESYLSQLIYITDEVISQLDEWEASKVVMEGLSFGSSGNMERQLGGLFYGVQVAILDYFEHLCEEDILAVTPHQVKKLARENLEGSDIYEVDSDGEPIKLKSGKLQMNKMKGKKWVVKALKNIEEDAWILDGYTRDGLVASRTQETGLEDLPDAYFIGRYCLNNLL